MSRNTDHWTKLKVRSMPLRGAHPGDVIDISSCQLYGKEAFVKESREGNTCANQTMGTMQLPFVDYKDNSSKKKTVLLDNLFTVIAPKSGLQKQWLNNCYQKRAREGFRYWLINRPPPTKFGRYGIGSYKTVMGVGMAPRT